MNRLKNTILCTLMLTRKMYIRYAVMEIAVTLFMMFIARPGAGSAYIFGVGGCTLIFMLMFGMSFYERHTAFCTANAVSVKYRIISAAAAAGVLIIIAAVYDNVSAAVIFSEKRLGAAEFIRLTVRTGFPRGGNLFADILEAVFLYGLFFSFGYFFGGIRAVKSSGFMLGTLSAGTALLAVSFVIGKFTYINPAGLLLMIPALMFRTALTACVFYGAASAGLLYLAYRMPMRAGTKKIEEQEAVL